MRNASLAAVLLAVSVLAAASPAAGQLDAAVFDGEPEFEEGDDLGYFIWRDGDTWKLRWTTFGAAHRFSGRVVVEGGEIDSFKRIDVDEERKVLRPGRSATVVRGPRGRVRTVRPGRAPVVAERTEDHFEQEDERTIVFTTETDDDIDGLDVKVTDESQSVRFFLRIDGEERPEEIEIGAGNLRATRVPVYVRLR